MMEKREQYMIARFANDVDREYYAGSYAGSPIWVEERRRARTWNSFEEAREFKHRKLREDGAVHVIGV